MANAVKRYLPFLSSFHTGSVKSRCCMIFFRFFRFFTLLMISKCLNISTILFLTLQ
jgi:hypothetical protein